VQLAVLVAPFHWRSRMPGRMSGWVVGVVLAGVVAIANFLWLPYQPIWSIIIIALSVLVIWALTVHGRDVTM